MHHARRLFNVDIWQLSNDVTTQNAVRVKDGRLQMICCALPGIIVEYKLLCL